MKNIEIHIGKIIKRRMYDKGLTTTQLAKQINRSREATRCILLRDSINTDMLIRISEVLDYDFFHEYSNLIDK